MMTMIKINAMITPNTTPTISPVLSSSTARADAEFTVGREGSCDVKYVGSFETVDTIKEDADPAFEPRTFTSTVVAILFLAGSTTTVKDDAGRPVKDAKIEIKESVCV